MYKGCKKLRTGYTTGSCAAAASKAAVWMLKHQKTVDKVTIDTPKGWKLHLDVKNQSFDKNQAICSIIKDAGDDPDITDGAHIYATVRYRTDNTLSIQRGKGVGIVTKEGLQIPIGQPAINPVPLQMISKEVKEVLGDSEGADIVISIPKGEELAKKTFNPKLGIMGGLSILGTTGIVEPMSEEALKDTIALELSMVRSKEIHKVVLVPGSMGERFLKTEYDHENLPVVKMSNYLGFTLEKCVELGFTDVIIAGHIGKLIKPAGGTYSMHSRVSNTRLEILTAYLAIMGMPQDQLIKIMDCTTTEAALEIVSSAGMENVYEVLANKAASNCEDYVFGNLKIGVFLFSMKQLLAVSEKARELMEDMIHV